MTEPSHWIEITSISTDHKWSVNQSNLQQQQKKRKKKNDQTTCLDKRKQTVILERNVHIVYLPKFWFIEY